MRVHCVVFVAVLVACGTSPLSAHHSVRGTFDANNPVMLSGVIAKLSIINPHATMELTGKDANGKTTRWLIEMASPGALKKRNIDPSSLAVGSQVTVEVWLSKDGENLASARTLTTSDGRKLDVFDNWADMVLPDGPIATPTMKR